MPTGRRTAARRSGPRPTRSCSPAQLRTDQAAGEWVSPDAGRVPLGQWAEEWLAAYVGRAASTQARARSVLRAHVLPRFADRNLSAITRFDVERMVNEIVAAGRSPATAEKALRTLSAVLAAAVNARLIRDNPAAACGLPAPPAATSRASSLRPRWRPSPPASGRPTTCSCASRRTPACAGVRSPRCASPTSTCSAARCAWARSLERGGAEKDTKTHSRRVVHLEEAAVRAGRPHRGRPVGAR